MYVNGQKEYFLRVIEYVKDQLVRLPATCLMQCVAVYKSWDLLQLHNTASICEAALTLKLNVLLPQQSFNLSHPQNPTLLQDTLRTSIANSIPHWSETWSIQHSAAKPTHTTPSAAPRPNSRSLPSHLASLPFNSSSTDYNDANARIRSIPRQKAPRPSNIQRCRFQRQSSRDRRTRCNHKRTMDQEHDAKTR